MMTPSRRLPNPAGSMLRHFGRWSTPVCWIPQYSAMPLRIHFISGLPRSGSTLLAAILRQNPRFRAAMSGPVADVFVGALNSMSLSQSAFMISDEWLKLNGWLTNAAK
jgi:hypothetical protein